MCFLQSVGIGHDEALEVGEFEVLEDGGDGAELEGQFAKVGEDMVGEWREWIVGIRANVHDVKGVEAGDVAEEYVQIPVLGEYTRKCGEGGGRLKADCRVEI